MPSLADITNDEPIKALYIGDSGTGKTGSLVSLVKAGYKLGIIDLDVGVPILKRFIMRDCPEKLSAVKVIQLRDEYAVNAMNQLKVKGQPRAFVNTAKFTTKWDDDTVPAEWGKDWIFVLDSLSTLGKAAHAWAESVNPAAKEPRTWFYAAQTAIENYVALLTGPQFRTNVLVITHVTWDEDHQGMKKGYASSIGKALGPQLPKYFNNLILAESSGMGKNVQRKIRTFPTGMIDLKTSAPFKVDDNLPLESGLATIFERLKS